MSGKQLMEELSKLSEEDLAKQVVVDCWFEVEEITEFEGKLELRY